MLSKSVEFETHVVELQKQGVELQKQQTTQQKIADFMAEVKVDEARMIDSARDFK